MSQGLKEFHERVEEWIKHGYAWNSLRKRYGLDTKSLLAELKKGGPYKPPFDDMKNLRPWQAAAWIERRHRLEGVMLDNPELYGNLLTPEVVRRVVRQQQKRMTVDLMRWGTPVEKVLDMVSFSTEDNRLVTTWVKDIRPAHFRERTKRALARIEKLIEKNPLLLDRIENHVKNGKL